jgi:membrane protease YdiL (CAAX protease family)
LIIIYNIIRLAAQYSAFYIGKALALSLAYAQALFVAVYFIGLIGIAIFLTFSSFYIVFKGTSIITSIKNSISLVKKNYLSTLTIILIFFIIITLLDSYLAYPIFNIISVGELIKTLFIYPLFFLVLARFLLTEEKQK